MEDINENALSSLSRKKNTQSCLGKRFLAFNRKRRCCSLKDIYVKSKVERLSGEYSETRTTRRCTTSSESQTSSSTNSSTTITKRYTNQTNVKIKTAKRESNISNSRSKWKKVSSTRNTPRDSKRNASTVRRVQVDKMKSKRLHSNRQTNMIIHHGINIPTFKPVAIQNSISFNTIVVTYRPEQNIKTNVSKPSKMKGSPLSNRSKKVRIVDDGEVPGTSRGPTKSRYSKTGGARSPKKRTNRGYAESKNIPLEKKKSEVFNRTTVETKKHDYKHHHREKHKHKCRFDSNINGKHFQLDEPSALFEYDDVQLLKKSSSQKDDIEIIPSDSQTARRKKRKLKQDKYYAKKRHHGHACDDLPKFGQAPPPSLGWCVIV